MASGARYPQPMTPAKLSVGSPKLVDTTPPYLPTSLRGYLLLLSQEEFQVIVDALVTAANSNSGVRIPIQSLLECLYRIRDLEIIEIEHFNAITSSRHIKPYLDTG